MKMLGLVFVVGILFLSVSASAADLLESQKEMTFVIERGGSANFMLLLFNTEANDKLFTDGDIEDWITFGDRNLAVYECENRGIDWVKVTIDVPGDTEVGEYDGLILSNKDYSEIDVKVVPKLDKIKTMQDLEVMKAELQAMTGSISRELNETKNNLQGKIAEISEYQQNVTRLEEVKSALEGELARLNERLKSMEEANVQLGGQVVGGSSAQIIFGVVVGIIIVILFLYRGKISKAFRSVKVSKKVESESYKGWKPR